MPATLQAIKKEAARPKLSRREVDGQRLQLLAQKDLSVFFQAIPSALLVLNRNRQALFANQALLKTLGLDDCRAIRGLRPGEIFNCVHSRSEPGGCGTTQFCRYCGAFNAMVRSYSGRQVTEICHIMLPGKGGGPKSMDLRVTATPMKIRSQQLTVIYAADITDQLRRDALERIFFHDVMNTAGAARAYVELLAERGLPKRGSPLAEAALEVCARLLRELQSQRDLLAAERGELQPRREKTFSLDLLRRVADNFNNDAAPGGVRVRIVPGAENFSFYTDDTLATRVLENLVRNAVEASRPGDTVTIDCKRQENKAVFLVHNPATMNEAARCQVFHGGFSTKGTGRGLGTYSVRLLTENYLKGQAGFASSPVHGTTFYVALPLAPAAPSKK